MSEFLDVPGASGAVYRFRRADPHTLPAAAGNLVIVRRLKAGPAYVLCAAVRSLMLARPLVAEQLRSHRGGALYVRLNVARATREAEHADIVAATQPQQHLAEVG